MSERMTDERLALILAAKNRHLFAEELLREVERARTLDESAQAAITESGCSCPMSCLKHPAPKPAPKWKPGDKARVLPVKRQQKVGTAHCSDEDRAGQVVTIQAICDPATWALLEGGGCVWLCNLEPVTPTACAYFGCPGGCPNEAMRSTCTITAQCAKAIAQSADLERAERQVETLRKAMPDVVEMRSIATKYLYSYGCIGPYDRLWGWAIRIESALKAGKSSMPPYPEIDGSYVPSDGKEKPR